jgi:hypothetical protein
MSKLRVIYQNLADTATITASSTASGYPVTNLQTDTKSTWHRSTSAGTVTYTLNWGTAQTIGGIVLPCTNLSKNASILVRFYDGANTQLNSGTIATTACVDSPIQSWTNPNGNQFVYGAVSKSAWWLEQQSSVVRKVEIQLQDSSNPAGYIDCARIICGPYWQPKYTADRQNLSVTSTDTTENTRTDSGSLVSDQGFVYDELQFSMSTLEDLDRDELVKLLQRVGTSRYLLFSVFPDNNNSRTEQLYTVYGKRTNSAIQYVLAGFTSHQVQVLGW